MKFGKEGFAYYKQALFFCDPDHGNGMKYREIEKKVS
ncbi:MAG: hypothetical protein JWR38_5566 [Mucilaginibacter sp.]|nr:hypothetical protein [Mucilaginibacter sp.]